MYGSNFPTKKKAKLLLKQQCLTTSPTHIISWMLHLCVKEFEAQVSKYVHLAEQHMNVTIRLQESTLHSSSSKIAISKQEGKVCFRRCALLSPWEDRETWISVYSTTPPDESYQLESGLCRRTILKQKNKNNGGESSLWLFFQSFLFLSIYFFVELVSIVSNLISQKS